MNKQFLILLLLALAAYGQQERIAIINTVDDGDSIKPSDLTYLTDRLRETAVNVLHKQRYGVMTTESIVAFLGSQERFAKECKAASCLAELGRKVSADYVAQARIGRFGGNLTIKTELYNVKSGNLIGSFTGNSKNIFGLLAIIDEKASVLFKTIPNVSSTSGGSAEIGKNKEMPKTQDQGGKFLTDTRDGKKYKIVTIGKQTWMAENLNYAGNNDEIGSCYGKKPKNCEIYGALYNWYEAKKICPPGWHLPNNEELETLVELAGGEEIAGKKLKAKNGWEKSECKYTTEETTGRGKVIVTEHDDCATDEFGFSALPGGHTWGNNENFREVGYTGFWWSATENDEGRAYFFRMYNGAIIVFSSYENKYNLYSVRCLKD